MYWRWIDAMLGNFSDNPSAIPCLDHHVREQVIETSDGIDNTCWGASGRNCKGFIVGYNNCPKLLLRG